jgi:hypothetical protein
MQKAKIAIPLRYSERNNMTAKYGKNAQRSVRRAMHKLKKETLKSGKSDNRVKTRKRAVAIGLSEARRKGAKVPAK